MSEIKTHQKIRVYHRYLGYFFAGIMAVYAINGFTMIFRQTGFLKREKQIEKELRPNMTNEELGRTMRMRDFKVEKKKGYCQFQTGTYNKATGIAKYTSKEWPYFIEKLTRLHKADTIAHCFF